MPVMILFRHGDAISLAVIDRELNKRDSTKDVLRKVTLIKDVRLVEPARAHIEILNELSLHGCLDDVVGSSFRVDLAALTTKARKKGADNVI
jgi:hypothetical protein